MSIQTYYNGKRPSWMRGLLWAEQCIDKIGLSEAGLIIANKVDEAKCFNDYTDFDRGAEACLSYYEEMQDGNHKI